MNTLQENMRRFGTKNLNENRYKVKVTSNVTRGMDTAQDELFNGLIVFLIEITFSFVSQLIVIKERNIQVLINKNIIILARGVFIM